MTEVAEPASRDRFGWRLRLLVVIAVLVTGFTVLGIVETLRYSSARPAVAGTSVGFFTPKSATPIPFSLPPLTASGQGQKTNLSQLLGKPLVLNMWASTCTVCRTETPAFERVARSLGAHVSFVGIDTLDESLGAGLAFAKRYNVTYEQLYDPRGVVATGYDVVGLPVTVFVSADGKVVGENVGALSDATLRHYVALLFGVTR
jgi:cytochrome c biogenesis protein CcmG/thiol:disulfide interchange protein DsbE